MAAATAVTAAVATAVTAAVAAGVGASTSPPALTMDAGGDWSGIPPEILQLISSFLTSIWDYVRFRGVCASWRSSAGRRPQTPYLILPYDLDTTVRSFLDPSDLTITSIDIPEARGKYIYGTPRGWLVMLGQQKNGDAWLLDVSLLNPITRDHIFLPHLPREFDHLPEQRGRSHTKPCLSGDPLSPSKGDRLAILMLSKLVYCRLGGKEWSVVDLEVDRGVTEVDINCFDGAFYAVDSHCNMAVITATHMWKYVPPPYMRPRDDKETFHLVESSGDLLLLKRSKIGRVPDTGVYMLDRSRSEFNWRRIEGSIGGRALFVSCNCASVSLSSSDFKGCGRDLICFAGYDEDQDSWQKVASMCVSDVATGSGIGRELNYWTDPRCVHKYRASLTGLTWFKPSSC